MMIRPYKPADSAKLINLFQQTVTTVNRQHYWAAQIEIWANQTAWVNRLEKQFCFVAVINSYIVGFITLTNEGLIDLLYVHKNFQRQGIASSLLASAEEKAIQLNLSQLVTEASITAEPFFESHHYKIEKKQVKKINNIPFTNYLMIKTLIAHK
ncbi:GNAT family N-acetyltransferase [Priestia megaterium]|nr:GNAT family N-acetyltransferase [Priestia megaterium]